MGLILRFLLSQIINTFSYKSVTSSILQRRCVKWQWIDLKNLNSVNLNSVCFTNYVNAFITDVSTKSEGWYVESSVTGDAFTDCPPLKNCKIWTRRFKSERDEETPLVMIHGMGAGLGFFSLNFDRLVQDRTVYAIDLPGKKYIWLNLEGNVPDIVIKVRFVICQG